MGGYPNIWGNFIYRGSGDLKWNNVNSEHNHHKEMPDVTLMDGCTMKISRKTK